MKELWDFDYYSHKVVIEKSKDKPVRRIKKNDVSFIYHPRFVVFVIVVCVFSFFIAKEARSVLYTSSDFAVKDVVVEDSILFNKNDVLNILNTGTDKGVFGMPIGKMKRILESDPDIAHVSIEKIIPDIIKMKITERVPVFSFKISDKQYLVDEQGRVLLREHPHICVPLVSGLDIENPVAGEKYNTKRLVNAIYVLGLLSNTENFKNYLEINNFDVANEDYVTIGTIERITLKLPIDNIEEKVEKLVLILSDLQKRGKTVKLIDLRFKDVYIE